MYRMMAGQNRFGAGTGLGSGGRGLVPSAVPSAVTVSIRSCTSTKAVLCSLDLKFLLYNKAKISALCRTAGVVAWVEI